MNHVVAIGWAIRPRQQIHDPPSLDPVKLQQANFTDEKEHDESHANSTQRGNHLTD